MHSPRVRPRGRAAQRDNGGRPPSQTVTGELRLVGSQRSAATCPRPEDGGWLKPLSGVGCGTLNGEFVARGCGGGAPTKPAAGADFWGFQRFHDNFHTKFNVILRAHHTPRTAWLLRMQPSLATEHLLICCTPCTCNAGSLSVAGETERHLGRAGCRRNTRAQWTAQS